MRTDYLFAAPSLSSGVARLLDLFGQFDDYNDGPSAASADARAMYSDWRVTGEDLAGAMMVIASHSSSSPFNVVPRGNSSSFTSATRSGRLKSGFPGDQSSTLSECFS